MTDQTDPKETTANPEAKGKTLTRRKLLMNSATAMPAILTLHSGAALARSSNLITESSLETVDALGRTLCVDKRTVLQSSESYGAYDLGDQPDVFVNVIPGPDEKLFYVQKDDKDSGAPISPGAMCDLGGEFWTKQQGEPWEVVEVNRGFVASAGAMKSIAEFVTANYL